MQCAAVIWCIRVSSTTPASTSVQRTTSGSTGPSVTAVTSTSPERWCRPWAGPTTHTASSVASAGKENCMCGTIHGIGSSNGKILVIEKWNWNISPLFTAVWSSRLRFIRNYKNKMRFSQSSTFCGIMTLQLFFTTSSSCDPLQLHHDVLYCGLEHSCVFVWFHWQETQTRIKFVLDDKK